jgi:hypothetical protein
MKGRIKFDGPVDLYMVTYRGWPWAWVLFTRNLEEARAKAASEANLVVVPIRFSERRWSKRERALMK